MASQYGKAEDEAKVTNLNGHSLRSHFICQVGGLNSSGKVEVSLYNQKTLGLNQKKLDHYVGKN